MGSQWRRSVAALACAGLLLAGCGDSADDSLAPQGEATTSSETGGPAGSTVPPPGQEDAAVLIERALAARSANRLSEFAELVSAAGKACLDPSTARRLGEVAVIAGRWSSAVERGRPKAQAVSEAQLASVDWVALATACGAS